MASRRANPTGPRPSALFGTRLKECPSCGSAMAFVDPHPLCIGCLGFDHAVDALIDRASCEFCNGFDVSRLQSRVDIARRGVHQAEGTANYSVDPEVEFRARGPERSFQFGSTRKPECPGALRSARSMMQDGGPVSGPSSRGPSTNPAMSYVNTEPLLSYDEGMAMSQSRYADVYMLSPRQAPEQLSPRCKSPREVDAPDGRPAARRVVLSQDVLSSLLPSSSEAGSQASGLDPDPALAMFKLAAERSGVTWPTCKAPVQRPEEPEDWPGIPPSPPKAPRERYLPCAKGLKNAVMQPWENHGWPPRHDWIRGIDGADKMGFQRLPPMDQSLAAALGELLRRQKTPVQKGPPPAPGYDLNKPIPFTDRAALSSAKDIRAMYETVGFSLRDVNALSLLLSSLSLKLSQPDSFDDDDYRDDLQELQSTLGYCNILCKHLAGWHGRLFDMLVRRERDCWLSPHIVEKRPGVPSWNDQLKTLPTSPTSLFPGGGEALKQVVADLKANEDLTQSLSAAPAVLQPLPVQPSRDNRGRPESKVAPRSRPPSASPAPNPNQRGAGRSGSRPPPNQPRHRSHSRGRGAKQGK